MSAERGILAGLSAEDSQTSAILDIKCMRLLRMRERVLSELRALQNSPEQSCDDIIAFAERTPDPFKPTDVPVKAVRRDKFEPFR